MADKKHCCETCKHFDRRCPYRDEDGDQVGLTREEMSQICWCFSWEDKDDHTTDIDWP